MLKRGREKIKKDGQIVSFYQTPSAFPYVSNFKIQKQILSGSL